MTDEEIDALIKESISKPKDEWTVVHLLAWTAAWQRADQEAKDMALAFLRGEIGVATKIWLPPVEAETKAVAHVKP